MIADSLCSYVSWTAPTIQEKPALGGEGEVTGVIRGKWANECHCGKAIVKCGCCIENILALVDWWFSPSINVPVDVAERLIREIMNLFKVILNTSCAGSGCMCTS